MKTSRKKLALGKYGVQTHCNIPKRSRAYVLHLEMKQKGVRTILGDYSFVVGQSNDR